MTRLSCTGYVTSQGHLLEIYAAISTLQHEGATWVCVCLQENNNDLVVSGLARSTPVCLFELKLWKSLHLKCY